MKWVSEKLSSLSPSSITSSPSKTLKDLSSSLLPSLPLNIGREQLKSGRPWIVFSTTIKMGTPAGEVSSTMNGTTSTLQWKDYANRLI